MKIIILLLAGEKAAPLLRRLRGLAYEVTPVDAPHSAFPSLTSDPPDTLIVVIPKGAYPVSDIQRVLDAASKVRIPNLALFHSPGEQERHASLRADAYGLVDAGKNHLLSYLCEARRQAGKCLLAGQELPVARLAYEIAAVFEVLGAAFKKQISIQRLMIRRLEARAMRGCLDAIALDDLYREARHALPRNPGSLACTRGPRAAYHAIYPICRAFNREARRRGLLVELEIAKLDGRALISFHNP